MKRLEQILEEVNKAEQKPVEGLQQIVFLLKNAFAEEMTAYYQYLILEYFASNQNEDKEFVKIFNAVISDFKENAKEELEDHAFWILGRLKELGADCSAIDNPSVEPQDDNMEIPAQETYENSDKLGISDDELISALTELEIEHFIKSLPGGIYETIQ